MDSDTRMRSLWVGVAVAVMVAITLSLVGALVWFRLNGASPKHPGARVIGTLNVANVDFSCSLPVIAYNTAALISLPGGQVTSELTLNGPGYKGPGAYSYDAALQRWVPVQQSWLSPDGKLYAYSTTTSGVPGQAPSADLHVKDVASGHDRVLWQGSGPAQILGWSGSSVYFSWQDMSGMSGPPPGDVWAVDSAGGQPHRIGPNPPASPGPYGFFGFQRLGGGALWGLTSTQLQPGPPQPGKPFVKGPNALARMDLRDGSVGTWYTAPDGATVNLIGVDGQGHPIVALNKFMTFTTPPPPGYQPPPPSLMLVTGRDTAVEIAAPGASIPLAFSTTADAHGVWFTAPGQLWLYRSGALKKVADVPAGLFPVPTPPPGVGIASKPGLASAPSIAMPNAPILQVAGACA